MITLRSGSALPKIVPVGTVWTYPEGGGYPSAGEFTCDSASISSTSLIRLSETVLGEFADYDSLWNFPENTRIVLTDLQGDVSVFKWISAAIQAGPVIADVEFERTTGTNWVPGVYAVAFMFQTLNTYLTDLGTVNGNLTLTISSASVIKYSARLDGNASLQVPSGIAPVKGMEMEFWATATGGNRNLTIVGGIKLPTVSPVITSPITILDGKTYILKLAFNGTYWLLQEVAGGF